MKKVLLLLTVICGLTVAAKAQTSQSQTGKFSIGVEAGLPLGDASDFSNFIIGGSLKYDHPIAENTFVTLSAGYNKFIYKSEFKDFGNLYAIPVKAGIKYFFDQGFYGEAQLGAAFLHESVGDNSGNATAFAYSPGIGYAFSPNVDLGVRYEGWSKNGTTSQVALRLAYSF